MPRETARRETDSIPEKRITTPARIRSREERSRKSSAPRRPTISNPKPARSTITPDQDGCGVIRARRSRSCQITKAERAERKIRARNSDRSTIGRPDGSESASKARQKAPRRIATCQSGTAPAIGDGARSSGRLGNGTVCNCWLTKRGWETSRISETARLRNANAGSGVVYGGNFRGEGRGHYASSKRRSASMSGSHVTLLSRRRATATV